MPPPLHTTLWRAAEAVRQNVSVDLADDLDQAWSAVLSCREGKCSPDDLADAFGFQPEGVRVGPY